jgi:hypothetical protein
VKNRSYRSIRLGLALFAIGSVAFTACGTELPDPSEAVNAAPKQKKGGGSKGASDAKSSGQKGGSNAEGAQGNATSQGPESDGLVCDASTESVGWCADDASIVFCSDENWWLLDCTEIDPEAFCGYDDELNVVDCYVLVDDECLDLDEGCADDADCCSGICDDEGFCDDGEIDECLDVDEGCVDDAECCSGFCDEEGFCDE